MGSMCTPFGLLGRFNRVINPDGWYRSLEDGVPLAYICGVIALMQVKAGRHFLCKNPHPTDLHKVHPWQLVMNCLGVLSCIIYQYMTGLRAPDGMLIKKPTGITASHALLVAHLRSLCWNGRHVHGRCWGGSATTRAAQVWTLDLCSRIVQGLIDLLKLGRRSSLYDFGASREAFPCTERLIIDTFASSSAVPAGFPPRTPVFRSFENRKFRVREWSGGKPSTGRYFPTTSTSMHDSDAPPAEGLPHPVASSCPACRSHKRYDDPSHTRVAGQCREWTCPGCIAWKLRRDSAHTLDLDTCKWALSPNRPRRTAAERPPRQEIRDEATREALGPDVGQMEQDGTAAASSSSSGAGRPVPAVAAPAPHPDVEVPDPPEPHSAARRAPRGPDRGPRGRAERARTAYAAVGSSPIVDWTSFDVTGCLRALRTGTEAELRRVLRVLDAFI